MQTIGAGDLTLFALVQNHALRVSWKDEVRAELVALFKDLPLDFEPGARWEYSNYGFLLLGVVIERVSGQSYYDYVRQNIFRPAGPVDTDFPFLFARKASARATARPATPAPTVPTSTPTATA